MAPGQGGTPVFYGASTTGSGTAQVLATVTPSNFTLTAGYMVALVAGVTNTGSLTLNINSTGATTVQKRTATGLANLVANEWVANDAYFLYFDGTVLQIIGGLAPGETVNAQTGTTYTMVAGDLGKNVTFTNAGSIAVTLPQATGSFGAGWYADVECLSGSVGAVTITPTTSTIDGATTLVLQPGGCGRIVSDGANYQVLRYFSPPTKAQMQTGTDNKTSVTPARTKDHDGVAKAWATFSASGGVIANKQLYGVSSITRNGAGDYTVNFSTNFADTNYAFALEAGRGAAAVTFLIAAGPYTVDPTVSAFRFVVATTGGTPTDVEWISATFWGRQ